MKKFYSLFCILSVFNLSAQEVKTEVKNASVLLSNLSFGSVFHSSDEIHYQFIYESQSDFSAYKETKDCNRNESSVLKVSYISKNLNINSNTLMGNGFEISYGFRNYLVKNPNKLINFYTEFDIINYGKIYFNDKDYKGSYEFFKIPIIPNLGYKFLIKKCITADVSVGMRYKIEIQGRGDVDNKNFSQVDFNAGFRLGYQF